MFEHVRRSSGFGRERSVKRIVGVVSAVYVASLFLSLFAGPVLMSLVFGVPMEAAITNTVAAVGLAYLFGMTLLLR